MGYSAAYPNHEFNPNSTLPPFPDEIGPCAQLETLSLVKLINGDDFEQAKLFDVCRARGFFFLDFSNSEYAELPQESSDICLTAQPLFQLQKADKTSYAVGRYKTDSLLGYKRSGTVQTDSTGARDTVEFWNIGKDDMLEVPGSIRVSYPEDFRQPAVRNLFGTFQVQCHQVGLKIMSILAAHLGLPPTAFEDKHRIDKPSDDHVRIIRGPPRKISNLPQIQTPGHTDFGLITILFNWLGGLQVWSEPSRGNFHQVFDGAQPQENGRTAEWLWVKPKAGLAIVNLGDAAVLFSGSMLCSARHRVVPPPGEQGLLPRYSVVYFVRTEDDAILKRLEGGTIPKVNEGEEEREFTSRQWIEKQYKQLREGSSAR